MERDLTPPGSPDTAYAAAHTLRTALDTHLRNHDRNAAVSAALSAVDEDVLDVASLYTLVLAPLLADTGAA